MNLITASWPDVAGFDTAFSHALVQAVAAGELGVVDAAEELARVLLAEARNVIVLAGAVAVVFRVRRAGVEQSDHRC